MNIEAFDLYSRAKTLNLSTSFSSTNQRSLLPAADLLNQAITRDPSFFLAYCELAHTHDQLYFYGIDHTPARRAMAEAAVEKAFALQPQAGEAHLARAETLYRGHLDFTGALAELDNARETLPNDARIYLFRGFIRRRQRAPDDGLEDLQRSLTQDPRNPFTLQQIALSYNNLRRYGEMAEVLDRALAINPRISITRSPAPWLKSSGRPIHGDCMKPSNQFAQTVRKIYRALSATGSFVLWQSGIRARLRLPYSRLGTRVSPTMRCISTPSSAEVCSPG